MAFFRQVQCKFWIDPGLEKFSPEDRYFYIMIMTNPMTKQCGIYEITPKQMADFLGYQQQATNPILDRFVNVYKKIAYNHETNEIAILNWTKYNFSKSPKVAKCIIKELKEVKDRAMIPLLYNSKEYLTLLIKHGYDIDTVYKDYKTASIDLDTLGIDFERLAEKEEKEKEKEKEKKQKKEKEKKELKTAQQCLDPRIKEKSKSYFGSVPDMKSVQTLYKIQRKTGADLILHALEWTLEQPSKSLDTTIAALEYWIGIGIKSVDDAKRIA